MKFRIISDIHQEFLGATDGGIWRVPPMPDDKNTCLLIAGDYCGWERAPKQPVRQLEWWKKLSQQFHKVYYVFGNHEYYDCHIDTNIHYAKHWINDNFGLDSNIIILNNDIDSSSGVNIVGSTLWGSIEGNDPIAAFRCLHGINDFKFISYCNGDLFAPEDMYNLYVKNREFIKDSFESLRDKMDNTILLTHHLPSLKSVDAKYLSSKINGAFVGDIEDLIEEYQPAYCIHGHTHDSMYYKIGKTVVIANPRGYYPFEQNAKFDPCLSISL